MHGGKEKEARPGRPCGNNQKALQILADDQTVIEKMVQKESKNEHSCSHSIETHMPIRRKEEYPDAGGIQNHSGVFIHLGKVNLENSQHRAPLQIGRDTGGPECEKRDEEMQEGKILPADIDVQINRQNKNSLQL